MMRVLNLLVLVAAAGAVRLDEDPVQEQASASESAGSEDAGNETGSSSTITITTITTSSSSETEQAAAALKASADKVEEAAKKAVEEKVGAEHKLNKAEVVADSASAIQTKLHNAAVTAANDAEVIAKREAKFKKLKNENCDAMQAACTLRKKTREEVPIAKTELEDSEEQVDNKTHQYVEARMDKADANVLKKIAEARLRTDEAAVDEARSAYAYKAKQEATDAENLDGLDKSEKDTASEVEKAKKVKFDADAVLRKHAGEEHAAILVYDAAQKDAENAKQQKDEVNAKIEKILHAQEKKKGELPVTKNGGPMDNSAGSDSP